MSTTNRDAAPLLSLAADIFAQGRLVHGASAALTILAAFTMLALAVRPEADPWLSIAAALVALTGLAETYLAVRIGFDAVSFRRLAAAASAGRFNLGGFDAAMISAGLMPAGKAGRSVQDRIAGTRRLFALQAAALLLQVGLLTGASVAATTP